MDPGQLRGGFLHPFDRAAATPSSGNPIGSLDSVQRVPGGIRAAGWTRDPNSADPIAAHAYSGDGNPGGGNPGAATTARNFRSDVGRHGYRRSSRHARPGSRRCACTASTWARARTPVLAVGPSRSHPIPSGASTASVECPVASRRAAGRSPPTRELRSPSTSMAATATPAVGPGSRRPRIDSTGRGCCPPVLRRPARLLGLPRHRRAAPDGVRVRDQQRPWHEPEARLKDRLIGHAGRAGRLAPEWRSARHPPPGRRPHRIAQSSQTTSSTFTRRSFSWIR